MRGVHSDPYRAERVVLVSIVSFLTESGNVVLLLDGHKRWLNTFKSTSQPTCPWDMHTLLLSVVTNTYRVHQTRYTCPDELSHNILLFILVSIICQLNWCDHHTWVVTKFIKQCVFFRLTPSTCTFPQRFCFTTAVTHNISLQSHHAIRLS